MGFLALGFLVFISIYIITMKPDKGDRGQAKADTQALKALKQKKSTFRRSWR